MRSAQDGCASARFASEISDTRRHHRDSGALLEVGLVKLEDDTFHEMVRVDAVQPALRLLGHVLNDLVKELAVVDPSVPAVGGVGVAT